MKRILFTANTDRHINLCHLPYLKWFKDRGYVVDVATNTDDEIKYSDNKINLKINRNPFSLNNIKAIFKLKKILIENQYDLIHTHTPVGSVVTRFACYLSKTNSKLIYTCHGFHFYKGAPIHYWLIYYPIEKLLMKYVDILLVMNKEDYLFALKHFKNVEVRYINGVGFDKERLDNRKICKNIYDELDISRNSFIVSYIAEFSKRKRQLDFIKELSKTDILNTNIKILLIGDDVLNFRVQKLVKKLNMDKSIKVIPFTTDIYPYLNISNVIISCSRQEGLPLNVMEAIYLKKFLIVTNCRGNVDLVKNGSNGFVVNNLNELYDKILFVKKNYKKIKKKYNQYIDIEKYSSDYIVNEVSRIYKELLWKDTKRK